MSDLPTGYRWADEDETDAIASDIGNMRGAILVERTVDSNGYRYTNGEADYAVPCTCTEHETCDFCIDAGVFDDDQQGD